jgi:dihydroxyacetone kinase-like protein
MLEGEIETTTVLGADDVASASPEAAAKRRGVAGLIFAYKAAGAAAESGANLAEVTRAAAMTVAATRSIGVALAPCRVPTATAPTFTLGDDEMEMGMGIHGEPGILRGKLKPADAVADEMVDRLLAERPAGHEGRVAVLLNSLGATPLEELFILYRRIVACRPTGLRSCSRWWARSRLLWRWLEPPSASASSTRNWKPFCVPLPAVLSGGCRDHYQ